MWHQASAAQMARYAAVEVHRRECAFAGVPPGSSNSLPTTLRDCSASNASGACSRVYLQHEKRLS